MSSAANPRAPKGGEISESTGPVAKDSLAAESIRSGGGFAENDNADILGVRGDQSTLANTETSGATVLHAAESGAAREKEDAKGLGSDEKGSTGAKLDSIGKPGFQGIHSPEGYVGGSSNTTTSTTAAAAGTESTTSNTETTGGAFSDSNDNDTYDPSKVTSSGSSIQPSSTAKVGLTAGSRPYVESAPGYAVSSSSDAADSKPKGKNLQEDNDIPAHRSTFTGDVGGPHDPAREAERTMLKQSSDSDSAGLTKDTGEADGGQYDVLRASEPA